MKDIGVHGRIILKWSLKLGCGSGAMSQKFIIIFEAKHVCHSVSLLELVMSRINIDTQKFYMKVIIILPLSELYIHSVQI